MRGRFHIYFVLLEFHNGSLEMSVKFVGNVYYRMQCESIQVRLVGEFWRRAHLWKCVTYRHVISWKKSIPELLESKFCCCAFKDPYIFYQNQVLHLHDLQRPHFAWMYKIRCWMYDDGEITAVYVLCIFLVTESKRLLNLKAYWTN